MKPKNIYFIGIMFFIIIGLYSHIHQDIRYPILISLCLYLIAYNIYFYRKNILSKVLYFGIFIFLGFFLSVTTAQILGNREIYMQGIFNTIAIPGLLATIFTYLSSVFLKKRVIL